MRTTKLIIILGLILSFSAFIFSATGYRISAALAQSFDESRSAENAMNSNVIDLLEKNQCGELIQIVNGRLKAGVAKQQLLSALAEDSKFNALTQGLLWIGAILIFITLLIRNKSQ